MNNNKYTLNVILSIALVALLLILTFKYIIKTGPIIKLALVIDVLSIYYAYKTIKSNQKTTKNKHIIMSEIEIEPKNILKTALFGGIGAIFIIVFFMSWTDIDPGEEGFVYRPYTGGIDTSENYSKAPILLCHGMK